MVRKWERTWFFKKKLHGKEKGENSIPTLKTNYMVRQKVKTWFLTSEKKTHGYSIPGGNKQKHGKEKCKNWMFYFGFSEKSHCEEKGVVSLLLLRRNVIG